MVVGDTIIVNVVLGEGAIQAKRVAAELEGAIGWQCGDRIGQTGAAIIYVPFVQHGVSDDCARAALVHGYASVGGHGGCIVHRGYRQGDGFGIVEFVTATLSAAIAIAHFYRHHAVGAVFAVGITGDFTDHAVDVGLGHASAKGESQTTIAISRPGGDGAATLLNVVAAFSKRSISIKVVDDCIVIGAEQHFDAVVVVGHRQVRIGDAKGREQRNRCAFVQGTVSRTTNHRCLINTSYRYGTGQIQTCIGVIAAVGGATTIFKTGHRHHAVIGGAGVSAVVLVAQAIEQVLHLLGCRSGMGNGHC